MATDFWVEEAPLVGHDLVIFRDDQRSKTLRLDTDKLRKVLNAYRDYMRNTVTTLFEKVKKDIDRKANIIQGKCMDSIVQRVGELDEAFAARLGSMEEQCSLATTRVQELKDRVEEQDEKIENLTNHLPKRRASRRMSNVSIVSEKHDHTAPHVVSSPRRASNVSTRSHKKEPLDPELGADSDQQKGKEEEKVEHGEHGEHEAAEEDTVVVHEQVVGSEEDEEDDDGFSKFSDDSVEELRKDVANLAEIVEEMRAALKDGPSPTSNLSARFRRQTSGMSRQTSDEPAKDVLTQGHLDELKYRIQSIDQKVDGEIAELETNLRKMRDVVYTARSDATEARNRMDSECFRIDKLAAQCSDLGAENESLRKRTDELCKYSTLATEIEALRERLPSFALAAATEERLERAELRLQKLGGSQLRADSDIILLKKQEANLASQLQQASGVEVRDVGLLREQLATAGRERRDMAERLLALEDSWLHLREVEQGVAEKADVADVVELRGVLNDLASQPRDKEKDKPPSVLFGSARCLSCNRNFDEVDPHAGGVDPRNEKPREQPFADAHGALRSPHADPLKPIRTIAARVGRPCGPGAVSGALQGRDAHVTCDVQDMSLVANRPSSAGTAEAQSTPSRPISRGRPCTSGGGTGGTPRSKVGRGGPKITLSHLLRGACVE